MVLMTQDPLPAADGAAVAADVAARLDRLCAWAAGAAGKPLPPAVRRRAALVLSDDVAAITVASREPQVAAGQEIILRESGPAEATVFRSGHPRASRVAAASANGMAITWAELDEGFRPIPCHAGAYAVPALLAEAEATGAATEDVLTALAVSYEVSTRIALCFPFRRLTVHPHGGFNAIGAAAALAALRRYDAPTFRDAVTAAATMVAPGPFNHATKGALVRNMWTSIGAVAGFRAADMAPLGIAGLETALTDVYAGCFAAARVEPGELDRGLGEAWSISRGYHKMFACCQYMHSAAEAALALAGRAKAERRAPPARIEVETHDLGLALTDVEPATVLAAKFSLPHTMASVALLGTAGAEGFESATLADEEFAVLRRKVSMTRHPEIGEWPKDRPGRVHWIFADGSRWTAECENARGGADQPFGEDELLVKFDTLARPDFPSAGAVLRDLVAGGGPESWRETVMRLTA